MTAHNNQFPTETEGLPEAQPAQLFDLTDEQVFDLRIAPVSKRLGDETARMLAYSGSIPGPTLRVRQGSQLFVNVVNEGDLEATVHWHGLRLDNRYDGTTETQRPMPVGGGFSYRLDFPDPGIYWYHPHIREDYGQEMGLYGNIVVVPSEPGYWPPAHRELALTLDDILIEDGRVAPFSRSESNYTAMGRFGNVLLVNGEPELSLAARRGEVVRLYLTNTANTRVFNVALPGARMKLVGGDSGRYEREQFVESVVLAPSERAVVDVLFSVAGPLAFEHRTPQKTYRLAEITVSEEHIEPSLTAEFERLRVNPDMVAERDRVARYRQVDPHKTLALVAQMDLGIPKLLARAKASTDEHPTHGEAHAHTHAPAHAHAHGTDSHAQAASTIEWEDDMVDINRLTTPANTRWKLIDPATGAEGAAIDWRFRVGDRVKIRLINEMESDHPMHHPFHIHGAGRFLILSRDGAVEQNLVWKDTVLVPTGQTVDILLDVTHPGRWMAHCRIASVSKPPQPAR